MTRRSYQRKDGDEPMNAKEARELADKLNVEIHALYNAVALLNEAGRSDDMRLVSDIYYSKREELEALELRMEQAQI